MNRGNNDETNPVIDDTENAAFSPAEAMSPEERVGSTLGGRYRLLRVLGKGGMGTVYAAEHTMLGKRFALKTMRSGMNGDPRQGSRFMREAQALALLHHPHIVEVFDFGVADAELYLVMELLEGQPLSSWLSGQPGRPPIEQVVSLLDQVLSAIEASHLSGVIHRDLKPDNLFLVDTPRGPSVKLVDFGLAHVDEAIDRIGKITSTGMVAGTPLYMSPEQCRSLSVGPAADLYSLGCILTEMLQGKPPFDATSSAELMAQHMFQPPPPLRREPGDPPVPAALEQLRMALLAKRPERRPPTATEVRRLLQAAVAPAGRQGDDPGDRAARAPQWEHPAPRSPEPPAAVLSSAAEPAIAGPAQPRVCLVLGGTTGAADPTELTLALASQGFTLVPLASLEQAIAKKPDALLLDVDRDDAAAVALLSRLSTTPLARRVIVIRRAPDIESINRLVAAGAADVVPAPVSADTLVKRLARLLRRRR